jgi:hypothetical protein
MPSQQESLLTKLTTWVLDHEKLIKTAIPAIVAVLIKILHIKRAKTAPTAEKES